MGIYLGSSELGGGGGSTPIGGIAYFIPRHGTTFTAGQEVYTNPDDSTVWIRSGARITSDGTGVLEAGQYVDSIADIAQDTAVGSRFDGGVQANRFGSNFDGRNVVVYGYNGSNGTMTAFNPDGTVAFTSGTTSDLASSASLFYNSTHTFISNRWIASVGTISLGTPNIRYVQTSTLTSFTNYNAIGAANWTAPTGFGSEFLACVTNAGTTDERHWWTSINSTTLTEHTFNSSATNGTSAWTATGNTITLPTSGLGKLQGNGNLLYAHVDSNLYEYNATTRVLLRTAAAPSDGSYNVAEVGLVLIPAASASSGSTEFWYVESSASSATPHYLHREMDTLYGPFKGAPLAPDNITLKDVNVGTTFSAANVYGSGDLQNIYLWRRIA